MRFLLGLIAATALHAQILAPVMFGVDPDVTTPTNTDSGGSCSGAATSRTCTGTTTVSFADPSADFIRYTNDGSTTPTFTTGTLYTTGISTASTTTYKAIGCKVQNRKCGAVLTSVYTISAGEPTFTLVSNLCRGTFVSSGNTFFVTCGSAPADGDAMVCEVIYYTGITVTSVIDGNSKSYTASASSPVDTQASARSISVYYLLNTSGASATINVTMSGNVSFSSGIVCNEFHRSAGTWMLDTDSGGSGALSTSINSPSITPAVMGEFLAAGVAMDSNGRLSSCTAPWVGGNNSPGGDAFMTYNLAASTGVNTVNCTSTMTTSWNAIALALK